MDEIDLPVVIACYDEEESIKTLYRELQVDAITLIPRGIFVDDGFTVDDRVVTIKPERTSACSPKL